MLSVTEGNAQAPANASCQISVSRQIPFSSTAAKDRLTVSIGPGACHTAELSVIVVSSSGKVLYRYVAPFKKHVSTQWDDPALPNDAHQFVKETAANALVPIGKRPIAKPKDQIKEGDAEITVPLALFTRLTSSDQPMLYHPTYYEGGQYVVFDPASRKAKVVARWGV